MVWAKGKQESVMNGPLWQCHTFTIFSCKQKMLGIWCWIRCCKFHKNLLNVEYTWNYWTPNFFQKINFYETLHMCKICNSKLTLYVGVYLFFSMKSKKKIVDIAWHRWGGSLLIKTAMQFVCNFSRLPDGGALLLVLLYIPCGLFLVIFRIFFALQLFLILSILPKESFVRR